MTAIITAIISGLPILSKLFDRFFPDRKDERAEMRKAIYGTKAFRAVLWFFIFLAVYEVALKTAAWVWPQSGAPDSIISSLEYVNILLSIFFAGIGG